MHRSRINGLLIDCKTDDIDAAAQFWADALGRPVDMKHPGTRGNYRMLETPPDELSVQVQRVGHESRVHIDIETDDIRASVFLHRSCTACELAEKRQSMGLK